DQQSCCASLTNSVTGKKSNLLARLRSMTVSTLHAGHTFRTPERGVRMRSTVRAFGRPREPRADRGLGSYSPALRCRWSFWLRIVGALHPEVNRTSSHYHANPRTPKPSPRKPSSHRGSGPYSPNGVGPQRIPTNATHAATLWAIEPASTGLPSERGVALSGRAGQSAALNVINRGEPTAPQTDIPRTHAPFAFA